MQLVSNSLVQDLFDAVARVALLSTASGVSTSFSGDSMSGTYPSILMGVMNSGSSLSCLL